LSGSQIPFFNQLKVRLIVGFLVVAYLPLGVSGSYAYIQAKTGYEEQVAQNVDGLAHMVRGQIIETINVADRQLGVWTTQGDAKSAPGVYGKTFMIFLLLQKRFRKFLTGQQELLPVFSSILCVQPANRADPKVEEEPEEVPGSPSDAAPASGDTMKSAAAGLAGLFGKAASKAKEAKREDKKEDDSAARTRSAASGLAAIFGNAAKKGMGGGDSAAPAEKKKSSDPDHVTFLPGAALVMFSSDKGEETETILDDFWIQGEDGVDVNPRYIWGGAEGTARPSPVPNPFDPSRRVLPIARKYLDAHQRETALVGLVDLEHVGRLISQTSVAGKELGERSREGDTHVAIISDNGEMVAGVVPQGALEGTSGGAIVAAARAIDAVARRMQPAGLSDSFVGVSDTGAEGWTIVGFKDARSALAPIRRLRNANIIAAILVLGFIFGLGAQLAGRITAPVKTLVEGTQIAAAGDLESTIDIDSKDEIGELATSFNVMIQRLKDSFEQVQQQNEELKRLDKLKSEFLANTSHELRTPINGISGLLSAMVDGAYGVVEESQKRTLTMALKSANRLKTLVDGILDFSSMQNQADGEGALVRGEVDISDVLGGELMVLFEGLNVSKGLQLSFEIPEDLPILMADEGQMRQLFTNVIGNAMKFTREGSVLVRGRSEGEGDDEAIVIEVQDTGVGIPEDQQEFIFEAFRQVTGAANREFEGTGLGLAIVMNIVKAHGGRIEVESEVGAGSTFTITLPLHHQHGDDVVVHTADPNAERRERPAPNMAALDMARPADGAAGAAPRAPVATAPAAPKATAGDDVDAAAGEMMKESTADAEGDATAVRRGNGELILVVDDEPINVEVLRARLDLVNYRVQGAFSGFDAVEFLQSEAELPKLVLLDIMMPGMSGFQLCERMKEHPDWKDIPIIMVSAKDQTVDKVYSMNIGAIDYVTKPFQKDELLSKVRTFLDLRAFQAALEELNAVLEDRVKQRTASLFASNERLKENLMRLKRAHTRLVEAEKMAGLGTMAAGLAHELNNALNRVSANIYPLQERVDDLCAAVLDYKKLEQLPAFKDVEDVGGITDEALEELLVETDEVFEAMSEGTNKSVGIIDNLLAFTGSVDARAPSDFREMDVTPLIKGAVTGQESAHGEPENIRTAVLVDKDLPKVRLDPAKISQVLANVLDNAYWAVQDGGEIEVGVTTINDELVISIKDTGVGITDEHLAKLYDPFFTGRPIGEGTGLGLTIAHAFVSQHSGRIKVQTELGVGTTFVIHLPLDGGNAEDGAESVALWSLDETVEDVVLDA
jgi:signal transduction histidine kinase